LNRFILRGELFDIIIVGSVDERRRFRSVLNGRETSTETFEDTTMGIGSGFVIGVGYD
jgi:hypothetical protein